MNLLNGKANHPTAPPRGFTLVELLVVITMVAVLALIVFTMARKGLEKAHTASCMSNLRQIGLALTAYQSENQGYPSQNSGKTWDREILPYLGYTGDRDLTGTGKFTKSDWPELDGILDVFACPSDKYTRSNGHYKRSYAIVPWTTNWSNGTSFRGWKTRPFGKGVPITIVTQPEKSALVVEWHQGTEAIENVCGSGNHTYHDRGGPDSTGREVHGNRQIVVFADAHTEILPFLPNSEFVKKYWPGSIGTVD